MKPRLLVFLILSISLPLGAEIRRETIEYRDGNTVLEGVAVYDDAKTGKRPGILVVHQWKGLGDYELKRAEMLAELGYLAFCADIYGKGVRASNPQDASKLASTYKSDRNLLRSRVSAGLARLQQHPLTDTARVGAIGYCFGGTTVLELARSGARVAGVVSFHGGLNTPNPDDTRLIQSRILALHGADDPFVPSSEVGAFEKEMRHANVDWQFISYGGAVHSFTDWTAGSDNSKGAAYNEKADKRSWTAMKAFFAELFGTP
ncbi:MAG: dienelactone hydrolase family protein [Verrucomicrobiales bacterium]|nr:dienelactone hydrolase family protein [Verrucomicrobiales bacterium]